MRRLPGDKTAALIVRWRSPHPTKKPMLILGHMDVVEAKREDWKFDPFVFREEGGYFLGRGTHRHEERRRRHDHGRGQADEQAGFKPDRDIIFFYSGDEETSGNGATLGCDRVAQPDRCRVRSQRRRRLRVPTTAKFQPLGCGISMAEKTFQTYFFTARNPRRPQLPAAARQCDLRPRRRAGEAADLPLHSRC